MASVWVTSRIVRFENRSASDPPTGPSSTIGRMFTTEAAATQVPFPVRLWNTNGIVVNWIIVPQFDRSDPTHHVRKSRTCSDRKSSPLAIDGHARTTTVSATNPAQQEIIDRLRGDREARPAYDAELRHHLRSMLEDGTADAAAALPPGQTIFVNKSKLTAVHGCEAKFVGDTFAWSIPAARGKVAHKAIEYALNVREEPVPLRLVDDALARLESNDDDFGRWLQGLREVERAELRGEVNERVTQFLECFPPLPRSWRPGTEMPIRQDLHDGRITLSGRVDLTIGKPDGLVAGKVLVDLKTGAPRHAHLDDLRFYALIETMRIGTPPLRLASYYLDQGTLHPEDVNEGVLRAAAARTIDGVVKTVELQLGREPRRAPSGLCAWCAVLPTCAEGAAWLAARDDPRREDDSGDW